MSMNDKEHRAEHDKRILEELLCGQIPSGLIYSTRMHAAMNRLAQVMSDAEPLTEQEKEEAS